MIPFDAFAEIPPREDDEHAKRDYLLDDFQLKRRKFAIANAIRGNLKTVFGERDQPAYDDRGEKRSLAVSQVAVPGDCHKNVRTNKKQDGIHGARIVSRAQLVLAYPAVAT